MTQILRLTTTFDIDEDRLKLAADLAGEGPILIWLTHRLATRLVRALVDTLERGAADTQLASEMVQQWEQTAACQALAAEEPVGLPNQPAAWLVTHIEVQRAPDEVQLVFRTRESREAMIVFNHRQLRQWLAILRKLYGQADWPLNIWPDWLTPPETAMTAEDRVLH